MTGLQPNYLQSLGTFQLSSWQIKQPVLHRSLITNLNICIIRTARSIHLWRLGLKSDLGYWRMLVWLSQPSRHFIML